MGSGFWFGLLFLVLHLALCGALWLLARSRALEVEGYFLPARLAFEDIAHQRSHL